MRVIDREAREERLSVCWMRATSLVPPLLLFCEGRNSIFLQLNTGDFEGLLYKSV